MQDESLENTVVTLHARGWAIRQLSREFGISRGRVRRIIMHNQQKRIGGSIETKVAARRASKLDAWKDYIAELLETYKNPPITVQRIFELLREKGFDGGRTILSNYLSGIRGKHSGEPVLCVETSPGELGSHDWSDYNICFTGSDKKEKVTFFSFILNYSRRQYIEVVPDKTQTMLFQCLVNTFIYFDGVPRQIRSDNQKACVDRWEYGRPVFNRRFLEFSTHYHFAPKAIKPGKPRENLKIERPFYYLEKSFLNGRMFNHVQDLKQQLREWLQNVNDQRLHRTTGKTPLSLYEQEYTHLQSLPQQHYDTAQSGYRVVNNESCIEWHGLFYIVPDQYMHQTCLVRQSDGHVIIYGPAGSEVIRHSVPGSEHTGKYVGARPIRDHGTTLPGIDQVIIRLESMGPVMKQYIEQVKTHKSVSFRYHLRKVLSLKAIYHQQDITLAVTRALRYKVYESGAIENFLIVNAQRKNEIGLFPKNSTSYEE